jgi:hypothetical protein
MGDTTLRLDPDNAAKSIAARLKTIEQCETYIRETVARYDGLKSFEKGLEALGATDRVRAIVGKE